MRNSELIGVMPRTEFHHRNKIKNKVEQRSIQVVGREPINRLKAPCRAGLLTAPRSGMAPGGRQRGLPSGPSWTPSLQKEEL